jgi:chromosome partitioning protein
VLPQSSAYVRCIDKGLTLFDLPLGEIEADLAHWKPLLQWLRPLVRPAANASEATPGPVQAGRSADAPVIDQPMPEPSPSPVKPLAPVVAVERSEPKHIAPRDKPAPSRTGLLGGLAIPSFLHRRS